MKLAVIASLALLACDDSAGPTIGPPDGIAPIMAASPPTVVGETLPMLEVEVRDSRGRAVSGAAVTWIVESGEGSVTPQSEVTNASGRARATWRLGIRAGEQRLRVSSGSSASYTFTATALPGEATAIRLSRDSVQFGALGDTTRLTAVAEDVHGNEHPASSLNWRSTDTTVVTVSQTGLLQARGLGTAQVRAESGSVFGATVVRVRIFNLSVEGLHITQATQTMGGQVPLVAGRPGLLRVFVKASDINSSTPTVRVEFFRNGQVIRTEDVAAQQAGVPTTVSDSDLFTTWNLPLNGDFIQPGLAVRATVDPNGTSGDGQASDNVFPRSATPLALDVRQLGSFRIRFVPILQQTSGLEATVGDPAPYLDLLRRTLPVAGVDADVKAQTFVTQAELTSDGSGWGTLLGDLLNLRTADGSNAHYYGVVKVSYTQGVAGVGYVGAPAALGWDRFPSASWVAAHEVGHNLSLRHSPCGSNVGGVDPSYPYGDGSIGQTGFDISTGALIPKSRPDLMSYCSNTWISDYTYRKALDFRVASGAAQVGGAGGTDAGGTNAGGVAAGSMQSGGLEPALVISGRILRNGLDLTPAFEAITRPSLLPATGSYRVDGLAADGRVLLSIPVEGIEAEHIGERHFSYAVPLRSVPAEITTLRLSGGGRAPAIVRASVPREEVSPDEVRVRPGAGGRTELEWDATRYPMVVVRDAQSGAIVSFARGGSVSVPAVRGDLEIGVSNGVRSVPRRIQIR